MKTLDEFIKGCEHDGSYVPVKEVKRLMLEYADQAIADHDAVLFPKAKDDNAKDGWTLDFQFIKTITDRTELNEYPVNSMEEVESVLMAFRDYLKELPQGGGTE